MDKPMNKKKNSNNPVSLRHIKDFSIYIRYPVMCHYVCIKIKAFLEFDHDGGFWTVRYISGKSKGVIDTLPEAASIYDIYFV